MLLQSGLEASLVDSPTALLGDYLRQIHGKTVGVVELERVVARHRSRGPHRDLVQPPQPLLDGLQEPLLLGARYGLDVGSFLAQLGIRVSHELHYRVRHMHQRRLAASQQIRVPHSPA